MGVAEVAAIGSPLAVLGSCLRMIAYACGQYQGEADNPTGNESYSHWFSNGKDWVSESVGQMHLTWDVGQLTFDIGGEFAASTVVKCRTPHVPCQMYLTHCPNDQLRNAFSAATVAAADYSDSPRERTLPRIISFHRPHSQGRPRTLCSIRLLPETRPQRFPFQPAEIAACIQGG